MKERKLDNSDLRILRCLESEGRMSFAELGEKVGLSKTPCWTRVRDLQSDGVISRYAALTNPVALGLKIRALVHIVISFGASTQFEQAVVNHRFIATCHAVTGEFDYVLEVFARDIQALDRMLRDDLSRLPGVQRFNTSISMRMVKQSGSYANMVD